MTTDTREGEREKDRETDHVSCYREGEAEGREGERERKRCRGREIDMPDKKTRQHDHPMREQQREQDKRSTG